MARRGIAGGGDDRRKQVRLIDPDLRVFAPVLGHREAKRSAMRGHGLTVTKALEWCVLHAEAGAGACAGGALTHRVDGQPRDGAGRRKHGAVGGLDSKGSEKAQDSDLQ